MNEKREHENRADQEIDRLLQDYQSLVEQDVSVDREEFIRRHPAYADQLRDYFANDDLIDEALRATPHGRGGDTVVDLPPTVGGFEIQEVIGSGGMGIVYQARQVSLNRLVALKTLPIPKVPLQLRKRFEVEGAAIARLQHPGVIHIIEVGEFDERPFIAMELMEGGNLAQRLAQQGFSKEEAAELVKDLAGAIDYFHRGGVLHRDLKPSNVLFTKDGVAKIGDFGLAKILDPDQSGCREITQGDALIGTPEYMAPEQAQGIAGQTGPETDIFGLGAILYRILTGRPPHQGRNHFETLKRAREGNIVRPSQVASKSDICADLEAICLKCLRKNPQDRYRSGEQLAADLQRWQNDEMPEARQAEQRQRRRKLITFGVGSIAATATACLSRAIFGKSDLPAEAGHNLEELYFEHDQESSFRFLPLGKGIAVECDFLSLLGLGESTSGDFKFEVLIQADTDSPSWDDLGGVGIFYAYRRSDTNSVSFRTIDLGRSVDHGLAIHNRMGVLQTGRHQRLPASFSFQRELKVVSAAQGTLGLAATTGNRPQVFWRNLRLDNRPESSESAGKFGIYNYRNAATFSEISIDEKQIRFSDSSFP